MGFTDKTLQCVECGDEFVFSAGEQEFFASREFTNDPKHCPDCRAARKMTRRGEIPNNSARRRMYQAVCAECGVETEVPFVPRQDRPVYCRSCYYDARQSTNY